MYEINQFVTDHWFLTWCALWLAWPLIWLLAVIVETTANLVFRLSTRSLRTLKVALRGWPPSHLDADGDWKEKGD